MTATDPLADFLPPYLAEVEELLVSARNALLLAETSARQGAAHPRAVRDLFRAVHTIKGLSAMVDVEPIVTVAHVMETSLREADRAGGRLAFAAIEPMLQGLQAIEQRLSAVRDKTQVPPPSPALLLALQELPLAGAPVAMPARPVALHLDPLVLAKLTAAEKEQLAQGVLAGRRAVRVDFAPSPALASAGRNINSVRERVAKVAELTKVLPLGAQITATQPGGLVFALLVLTREPNAALCAAAGVGETAVTTIADPPSSATVSGPSPSEMLEVELPDLEGGTSGREGLVRVQISRLDDAMERLGALVVNRSRLARVVTGLKEQGFDARELSQVLAENARLLRDMRTSILRIRMVRVAEVLDRLPLMVRGLQRTTGHQVKLDLDVGNAEVDKAVGDRLFPAIVHLVRNAVDHALEPPEERIRLGKNPTGTLRVSCHERSNSQLELVISDDGRGIDAKSVAERANVEVPTTSQTLLELLCRPGLSTRSEVTTTSGRGMGMDIVRRVALEELGGELRLDTTPGRGTSFTLRVPLTISIVDAFVFVSGGARYAAAVSTVDELLELDLGSLVHPPAPKGLARTGELGLLHHRGAAVPVVRLNTLLHQSTAGSAGKALLVRNRGRPVAFAVDRLVSQQEIVIRRLDDPLVAVSGVSGATDLGDGVPTLVLDLMTLSRPLTEQEIA